MPTFFKTPAKFRAWLKAHASDATELVVGFYKTGSGHPSITWPEAVDEALCVGWIDGLRKRIDDQAYQIRFTPRKPGSTWSAININRVRALHEQGRMQAAGTASFALRSEVKSGTYSYEQAQVAGLEPAAKAQFRKNKKAWSFFQAQTPGYRKRTLWWVAGAKQAATRASRLARLIEASKKEERL